MRITISHLLQLFNPPSALASEASESESCQDPCQAGGILFHVVEFCDLRGRAAEEVGHLSGREGAERSIRLFDSVDQIGGEGVSEGMEPPLFPPQPLNNPAAMVSVSAIDINLLLTLLLTSVLLSFTCDFFLVLICLIFIYFLHFSLLQLL